MYAGWNISAKHQSASLTAPLKSIGTCPSFLHVPEESPLRTTPWRYLARGGQLADRIFYGNAARIFATDEFAGVTNEAAWDDVWESTEGDPVR